MKQADHADRGRRRKSNDSDHDMLDVPEPDTKHRHRRQSDNVVDEGLRGRPRQRSDSRSVSSQPLSTPSDAEESQGDSHISKHKRKRSQHPADTMSLEEEIATTSAGDGGVCPTSMRMRIDTVLVRDGTSTIGGRTIDTGLREIDTVMMAVLAAMMEGLEADLTVITNPLSNSRDEAL